MKNDSSYGLPLFRKSVLTKPVVACFCGVIVGVVLGIALAVAFNNRTPEDYKVELDNNHDGKADAELFYEKGKLAKSQSDRNHDGKWDYFEWYEDDIPIRAEADDNFDGKTDAWITFKDGTIDIVKRDLDGNGIPDEISKSRFGILRVLLCRPNGSTNNVRFEFYQNGVKEKEYRDTHGTGMLDKAVLYDKFGNVVLENNLVPPLAPRSLQLDFDLSINSTHDSAPVYHRKGAR